VLLKKWLFFLNELYVFPYSYFSKDHNNLEKYKFFFSINFLLFKNVVFLNFFLNYFLNYFKSNFKNNFLQKFLLKKNIFLKKKTTFFYKFIFFKKNKKSFNMALRKSNFFFWKFIFFQKNNLNKTKDNNLSVINGTDGVRIFYSKKLIYSYFRLKKFPLTGYYFNRSFFPIIKSFYGEERYYKDRPNDDLNLLKNKIIFKSQRLKLPLFKKMFLQNYFYLKKNFFFWNIFFKIVKKNSTEKLIDERLFKIIEWPNLPLQQVNLSVSSNFKKIHLNANKITLHSLESFSLVYRKFKVSFMGKRKKFKKKFKNFSSFSSLLFSKFYKKKTYKKNSDKSLLLANISIFRKKFNFHSVLFNPIKKKFKKNKIFKSTFYLINNQFNSSLSKSVFKKSLFLGKINKFKSIKFLKKKILQSHKYPLKYEKKYEKILSFFDIIISQRKKTLFFLKRKHCFFFIKNYLRFLYKRTAYRIVKRFKKIKKNRKITRKVFFLRNFSKKNKFLHLIFFKKKFLIKKKIKILSLNLIFKNIFFKKYKKNSLILKKNNFFFFFNKYSKYSFSRIFLYKISSNLFLINKSIRFFSTKNSRLLVDSFYDFLFSRIDFKFTHSFDGFLYTYTKSNFESYPVRYCYLFRKTTHSFIFKNDLQNFIIKKHLKSFFNPTNINFSLPRIPFFEPFFDYATASERLDDKNYFFKNYFATLIYNEKQNVTVKSTNKTSYFEILNKVRWVDHKMFLSYISFLNDIPINFSIKKVKFKPGYQNIWREARECFKISLNIKLQYQHRLTKFINQFKKIIKKATYSFFENQLHNILKLSKIIPDMSWAFTFIQNGSIFVNNKMSLNPFMQLFKNDFIQLIINYKYYIFYKWIIIWASLHKFKFKAKINNKLSKKDLPDDKQRSFKLPLWVLRHRAFTDDVPKNIEVDYLTLSFFIIYEFHSILEFDTTPLFQQKFPIFNMYNWKYIN